MDCVSHSPGSVMGKMIVAMGMMKMLRIAVKRRTKPVASFSHVGMVVAFLIGTQLSSFYRYLISFTVGFVMVILIVLGIKRTRLIVEGRETTPILVC